MCCYKAKKQKGWISYRTLANLGQRIFDNVSKEGWRQWLERLTTIINENGISTMEFDSFELIEKHMLGFFFGEGDFGQLPAGFRPAGSGGKK